MAAQVAAVVLDGRRLALHHVLQVVDVLIARIDDRALRSSVDCYRILIHAPAQLALGLYAGEPIATPRLAFQPDPTVRLSSPGRSPSAIPALAPARVARKKSEPVPYERFTIATVLRLDCRARVFFARAVRKLRTIASRPPRSLRPPPARAIRPADLEFAEPCSMACRRYRRYLPSVTVGMRPARDCW